jgi:diacylglycerol kinase (ATP)
MSENKKVFFIINKYSGTGYRPDVEGKIIAACGRHGLECTLEFTQRRGHATELAQLAVAQHFDLVFAVGGDGTVNEVAQGLLNSGLTMGILPKGSGNGLARHLGIPMRLSRALSLLESTRTIMMDTLNVNGKLSVNISGIGFDGHVAGMFGKNGHKRGLFGYAKLVLKEFARYPEVPVAITLDGKSQDREAFVIGLANSSQFGNNARIAPHASVCDEVMDVCVVRKVPLTQFIGFAQKMFTGRIDRSAFVEIIPARKVTLKFPRPVAYHIDGEAMEPRQEFSIEVNPASLKMLLPLRPSANL